MTVALFVEATAKASASSARTWIWRAPWSPRRFPPRWLIPPRARARWTDAPLPPRTISPTPTTTPSPSAATSPSPPPRTPPAFPVKSLGVGSTSSSLQSPGDVRDPRADRPDRSAARATARGQVPTPRPEATLPRRAGVPHRPRRRARGVASRRLADSTGVARPGAEAEAEARDARTRGNGTNPAPLVFDGRRGGVRVVSRRRTTSRAVRHGPEELQGAFRTAFRRATTSNNQWLRRRIAGALGIENAFAPSSHAVARRGVLTGARGGRGGGRGFRGDAAAGTVFAEDGVRKSSRAAKPKILDFLPSAVCVKVANEAPGASAIDRRVRVFWPAEGVFRVGGGVQRQRQAWGSDDGGVEEVLLAAERIEWVDRVKTRQKFSRGRPPSPRGGALSSRRNLVVANRR